MARTGRPIKDFEIKVQTLRDNGFPDEDVSPWWRKFHNFCNVKALRPGVENRLSFADYVQKAREAGITSPDQIGKRAEQFQMGRLGDAGHYEPHNCRFITKQQNIQEAVDNDGHARGVEKKRLGIVVERSTPTTQHVAAKAFRVTAPDGTQYAAQNVRQFAAEFGLLPEGLTQALAGRNKSHVGRTGEYDDTPEELIQAQLMGIEVDAIIIEGSA